MTRPNDPVPSVFSLSNSSRLDVFFKSKKDEHFYFVIYVLVNNFILINLILFCPRNTLNHNKLQYKNQKICQKILTFAGASHFDLKSVIHWLKKLLTTENITKK